MSVYTLLETFYLLLLLTTCLVLGNVFFYLFLRQDLSIQFRLITNSQRPPTQPLNHWDYRHSHHTRPLTYFNSPLDDYNVYYNINAT